MTHELDGQEGEAGAMGGGVWMVFVLMRALYQRESRIYEKLSICSRAVLVGGHVYMVGARAMGWNANDMEV